MTDFFAPKTGTQALIHTYLMETAQTKTPTFDIAKLKAVPAPACDNPLKEYLSKHPDFAIPPGKATSQNLKTWLTEVDDHVRGSVRAAYLVGRALLVNREKLNQGEVTAWTDEQASKLGRSPRTVRLYMQVAGAIDEDLAFPVPISVLDRPLCDIPRVIRNIRAGRDPDANEPHSPRPPTLKSWRRSFSCLIDSANALPESHRSQALLDLIQAIADTAETLPPKASKKFKSNARSILGLTYVYPRGRNGDKNDQGTPEWLISKVHGFAARGCCDSHNGRINLDPASSQERNKVIQADNFFTKEDDGLQQDWMAHFLWLNPPFGTINYNESVAGAWFCKAVTEYQLGHFEEGIILLPLYYDRTWFRNVDPWPRVDLKKSVRFIDGSKEGVPFITTLVYLGPNVEAFHSHFRDIANPVPGVPPQEEKEGPNLIVDMCSTEFEVESGAVPAAPTFP